MNLIMFWETYVGFLKMLFCNFSLNITKVISIWRLKVAKNLTAHKKGRDRLKVSN